MQDIYKEARRSERRSNKNARERVHAYVQQLAEATAKEQAASGGEDAETPLKTRPIGQRLLSPVKRNSRMPKHPVDANRL